MPNKTPSENPRATKKAVAKKAAPTKKAVAKKAAPTKKAVAKKAVAKKAVAKKAVAKKAVAKKAVAKKAVAKKAAPTKKAVSEKSTVDETATPTKARRRPTDALLIFEGVPVGAFVCTQRTLDGLNAEVKYLDTTVRKELATIFEAARGDEAELSENSTYMMAMEEHSRLESRLLQLRDQIARAHVMAPDTSKVVPGVVVRIKWPDGDTEELLVDHAVVGDDSEVVSPTSPLGMALLGARVGQTVSWDAPAGTFQVKITKIALP